MDYYFQIELTRKVATPMNARGMDTAVCRAKDEKAAIAQLLPEMRSCVRAIHKRTTMRACYPNPEGILKDCVI